MEEVNILEISNGGINGDGSCSMDMENSGDILQTGNSLIVDTYKDAGFL